MARAQCQTIRLAAAVAVILVVCAMGAGRAGGQPFITQIIDNAGDD